MLISDSGAKDQPEVVPLSHPRSPLTTSPRYFINKQAVIYICARENPKQMKATKQRNTRFILYIGKKKQSSFRLAEIMACTFWDKPFDSSVHWFFYKDGNRENCAWDNLVICDLPTLQQLEIARLEKSNPGTKYTVVRNVHNTFTFERYLVSDAGEVYSLIRRRHNRPYEGTHGYHNVHLSCDTNAFMGNTLSIHSIVLQSFKGRRIEGLQIDHRNGLKQDNSLKNLAFVTRSENIQRAHQSIQKTARDMRKKQGHVPKKPVARPIPVDNDETTWKTIGALPWKRCSFNRYQVSDMGHVRKVNGHKLLKGTYTSGGYITVKMSCDDQDVKDNISTAKSTGWFNVGVSRLVAKAFVDGYSETRNIVKHLNGDRSDNRAQNLQWISIYCSIRSTKARRVVAVLVDDPKARKEFPSIVKAQRELSIYIRSDKYSESVVREVDWDGTTRMAIVQVF